VPKKSKKKRNGTKPEGKAAHKPEPKETGSKSTMGGERPAQNGKNRPMLRAIRITQEILDAAKTYKKSTGISFYLLGLEAITDRLEKEGFLKKATQ